MKNRYLLYLSYKGTHFRGLAPQINVTEGKTTVLDEVYKALNAVFRIDNEVKLISSSRTDAGVHAIRNTVHLDLDWGVRSVPGPKTITAHINKQLWRANLPLRIMKIKQVSDEFHCRYNAVGRVYVYRLCLNNKPLEPFFLRPVSPIDWEHIHHCGPCDIELMEKAADRLSGIHDFTQFTSWSRLQRENKPVTIRNMDIDIQHGLPFLSPALMGEDHEGFSHFSLTFKSKSFLYRQVRNMVATIVAVGKNKISLNDLDYILENPSLNMHPRLRSLISSVPPHGLYLQDVLYNEEDLMLCPKKILQNQEQVDNVAVTPNGGIKNWALNAGIRPIPGLPYHM